MGLVHKSKKLNYYALLVAILKKKNATQACLDMGLHVVAKNNTISRR